jgi:hypothetical protein
MFYSSSVIFSLYARQSRNHFLLEKLQIPFTHIRRLLDASRSCSPSGIAHCEYERFTHSQCTIYDGEITTDYTEEELSAHARGRARGAGDLRYHCNTRNEGMVLLTSVDVASAPVPNARNPYPHSSLPSQTFASSPLSESMTCDC